MAVVTVSRQLGSGGAEIGRVVADILEYRFIDKGMIETILKEYGFAEFDRIYDSVPGFWDRFDETRRLMVDTLARVMRSLARQGRVVLLGRGGFAVLAGFSDVLNVRIQAPAAARIQRLAETAGLARDEAEAAMLQADRVTAGFVESFPGARWDDATGFDLVLNTGKLPTDLATAWLVEAVRGLEADPGEHPATADPAEDVVLDEYLAGLLSDL